MTQEVSNKKTKPVPKKPAIAKKDELTQKIYVGPNLLELPKYTVVEDEFTPHMEDLIKKCPAVGKLFVKIEDMPNVESRAQEKGTLEHRHFNKVIAYASGKGDE